MNIESYSIGRGYNALSESKDEGFHTTTGIYYSPHGVVSCYAEVRSDGTQGGTSVDMVLHGRQWRYGDRIYRGKLSMGRLAAKFARQVASSK